MSLREVTKKLWAYRWWVVYWIILLFAITLAGELVRAIVDAL